MSLASWFARNFDAAPKADWAGGPDAVYAPRLVARNIVTAAPSRDEFEAWRDDGVTKFVMAALLHTVGDYREQWLRKSWDGGSADQRTLDVLRERADALLDFTGEYEEFCAVLGLEPEEERDAA